MYNNNTDFLPSNSDMFHIAIIPDGGRRWARENSLSFFQSYMVMIEKIIESIKYFFSNNVDIVSVYFSSVYNFKRPGSEIKAFCEAETIFFEQILPVANLFEISVVAVGDILALDNKMISSIRKAEQLTQNYTSKKLFICVNYSSLNEISKAIEKSHNECFVNKLDIPYPVNMLIRTGDANVLSDFLLPQCACTRLFFLKKMFNDIVIEDYIHLINEYNRFELKYGE